MTPTSSSPLNELEELQRTFNQSIEVLKECIVDNSYPPLSNFSTVSHPLDDPELHIEPKVFEARRLALGEVTLFRFLVALNLL